MYGANKSLINLFEGLLQYEINLKVIMPEEGSLCTVLDKMNIDYVIYPFHQWCEVAQTPPKNIMKRLIWRIRKYRVNSQKLLNNLEIIESINKTLNFKANFIYSNSSVFNFGLLLAKSIKIPHIWHLRETQDHYNFIWLYSRKYVEKCFCNSEIIIAISNYVKAYYEVNNCIKKINVIHDSVIGLRELHELDNRKLASKKAEHFTFGIIGLIGKKKGQVEAIRAFSIVNTKFPDTRLNIIGDGNQIELIKLISELKIEHSVNVWGHINDPYKAFLEMDVCLMCSRQEGLGRVSIEAMATGVPVIGHNSGGTLEVIKDNVTGLFYEKGYEELAEKMIFMIENHYECLRMGRNAREIMETVYINEIYTQKFIELIQPFTAKTLSQMEQVSEY